jgi:hypothetical protein
MSSQLMDTRRKWMRARSRPGRAMATDSSSNAVARVASPAWKWSSAAATLRRGSPAPSSGGVSFRASSSSSAAASGAPGSACARRPPPTPAPRACGGRWPRGQGAAPALRVVDELRQAAMHPSPGMGRGLGVDGRAQERMGEPEPAVGPLQDARLLGTPHAGRCLVPSFRDRKDQVLRRAGRGRHDEEPNAALGGSAASRAPSSSWRSSGTGSGSPGAGRTPRRVSARAISRA